MGTATGATGSVALRTGAALALAAGAGALGVYMLRHSAASSGYHVSSAPARGSGKGTKKSGADGDKPAEGPEVRVFFGSQTGTAEEFAKTLAKDARSQGINAIAVDLERFDPASFTKNSFAIFLVATYGEGDPTDNAKGFHDWLARAAADALAGCSFAVFGLGNTQYEHYNSEGKFVDNMCEKCGGSRMLQLGLGDDDKNIREDFDEWVDQLFPALRERLGMDQSSQAWLDQVSSGAASPVLCRCARTDARALARASSTSARCKPSPPRLRRSARRCRPRPARLTRRTRSRSR